MVREKSINLPPAWAGDYENRTHFAGLAQGTYGGRLEVHRKWMKRTKVITTRTPAGYSGRIPDRDA
jgi:hypothetical protein